MKYKDEQNNQILFTYQMKNLGNGPLDIKNINSMSFENRKK